MFRSMSLSFCDTASCDERWFEDIISPKRRRESLSSLRTALNFSSLSANRCSVFFAARSFSRLKSDSPLSAASDAEREHMPKTMAIIKSMSVINGSVFYKL